MIQVSILILFFPSFIHTALASYTLQSHFNSTNFFNSFSFFNSADPTNGTVQYLKREDAFAQGLAYIQNKRIILRADNITKAPDGRPSVRVYSNEKFNHGLYVFDLNHMPFGCGVWPAYWMRGPTYEAGGEIDIIEGVNLQKSNGFNLHTNTHCTMEGIQQNMTGIFSSTTKSCNIHEGTGCGVQDTRESSYGVCFNKNGGGVYVMRWEPMTGIQMWFFPHGQVPKDIYGLPKPETWEIPVADYPFGSNCDSSSFMDMRIIVNLTFCGHWAGNPSSYDIYDCPSTCENLVKNKPSAFSDAYWDINSLKVYKKL